MKQSILLVEDDVVQSRFMEIMLTRKLDYNVITAENGKKALDVIQASNVGDISAILLDISMPVMDGFEALKLIRKYRPDLPVIMLTGHDDTNLAVRAIKEGANDFIVKPANPAQLDISLQNAIRISSLTIELSKLKRDKEGALLFSDLVGYNSGLSQAVAFGRRAAASDVPVLITGETGVGKELFARAIHGESARMGAPFIAINCGAIPENLVESILFGHEKGAFTGAVARTIGKFREADGGTIFLDEIGELPLDAQVKLLRAIQQKEVEPVGAGKPVKVNIRIISATNRDLKLEVKEGRFREDLYFRLNVLPVNIPPLRDRKSDLEALTGYFMQRLAGSYSLPLKPLSGDAMEYLRQCKWSGNVRELENLIHRALVLSDNDRISGAELEKIHNPDDVISSVDSTESSNLSISLRNSDCSFKTMSDIEAEVMHLVLEHFGKNITSASEVLGIAKSTFYRKMKDDNRAG